MRFRLTKTAKVLIMLLIVVLLGGGIYAGLKTGLIKTNKDTTEEKEITEIVSGTPSSDVLDYDNDGNVMNTTKTDDNTINLSLDEWIGWKSVLDSNGGLTTQPGSIYDQLGIKVNISIINDAIQSSNALIKGSLDAAGYTINRVAFLSSKFNTANFEVVMPYITNYSNGGDGIIAKSSIQTVNDLVGAKIGVPEFSEAETLVVWFVNQSDLSDADKKSIINNLIFFETADETAKAFFAGQVDVAATWEPYLTQAQNMSDAHIFFSTASSSSLVMDGILFSKEFAENHAELVQKFIQGSLMAADLYETDLTTIKKCMPMFSTASDQDILDNCVSAKLATWTNNKTLLNDTARVIYSNMCNIWTSIGEEADPTLVKTLFDDDYICAIEDEFDTVTPVIEEEKVVVTEEKKDEIVNSTALLQKTVTVNFIPDTAKFLDSSEASASLDEFIEIAKVLDGSIIQIEGNIASDNASEEGVQLSYNRAETVKNYFVLNGIDSNRIIVIGNGGSKPLAPNDTEENKAQNRRTDISFKLIEQ